MSVPDFLVFTCPPRIRALATKTLPFRNNHPINPRQTLPWKKTQDTVKSFFLKKIKLQGYATYLYFQVLRRGVDPYAVQFKTKSLDHIPQKSPPIAIDFLDHDDGAVPARLEMSVHGELG